MNRLEDIAKQTRSLRDKANGMQDMSYPEAVAFLLQALEFALEAIKEYKKELQKK